MAKSRLLTRIGATLICALCSLSTLRSQEPPVRPLSDSSASKAGTSGTNYLRQDAGRQASAQTLQRWFEAKEQVEVAVHTVAPTSDNSNKSEKARYLELMEQIEPSQIHAGELESYTKYQIVIPNVDAQHYAITIPTGTTPAMIRRFYNLGDFGGSGVIAIVDAYHYPNAPADLAKFSSTFGLPALPLCSAVNSFQSGTPCLKIEAEPTSPVDCGWSSEAALDLEWAHAIAPNASLLLLEAPSNQNGDLYSAVAKARDEITAFHGQLSMSWATASEDSQTATYGSTFTDGVLYFAATGDTGGQVGFPASFPSVIAVGGTFLMAKLTEVL